MTAIEIGELRERARAGDPGALTALGKRLLIGDGVRQDSAGGRALPERGGQTRQRRG